MFLNKSLVALDMGSSAIKMVELGGRGLNRTLKSCSLDLMSPGLIDNGAIANYENVLDQVKNLVRDAKIKNRHVALCLSGSGVILKKIRVTIGKDTVIDDQINFHAEQAFQMDLNDLYFDFSPMGLSRDSNTEADVLLVGARREMVEQYISLVKDSGLQIGAIEASAVSLGNAFELTYGIREELVVLVSVGASHIQLVFIQSGRILYTYDSSIGGNVYTNALAKALSVSSESAEALKITSSLNPSRAPKDVLQVFEETHLQIISEVRQIMGYFAGSSESYGLPNPSALFLTGGGAMTLGLAQTLSQALGIPAYLLAAMDRVQLVPKNYDAEYVSAVAPIFATAIGLATRERGDKVAA